MSDALNKLRLATIAAPRKFRKETVVWDGQNFEIRQLSMRSRKDLAKQCTGEDGLTNALDFTVWVVIYSTYIPGTDQRVFSDEDYDTLMDTAPGSFVDQFGVVAMDMLNIDTEAKKNNSDQVH